MYCIKNLENNRLSTQLEQERKVNIGGNNLQKLSLFNGMQGTFQILSVILVGQCPFSLSHLAIPLFHTG